STLRGMSAKPILIGTWSAASWAIRFYEKNGYRVLSRPEIERLLHKYWSIPERQIEASVVLEGGRALPQDGSGARAQSPKCLIVRSRCPAPGRAPRSRPW